MDINAIRAKTGVNMATYDFDFELNPRPRSLDHIPPEDLDFGPAEDAAIAKLRQRSARILTGENGAVIELGLSPEQLTDDELAAVAALTSLQTLSIGQRVEINRAERRRIFQPNHGNNTLA